MRTALLLIFFLLPFSSRAGILDAKQLFNKKVIEVQKKKITLKKSFYATTTIDESRVREFTIRFGGFVEKLYVTRRYAYLHRGDKLFTIYSDEINSLLHEYAYGSAKSTLAKLQNLAVAKSEYRNKGSITLYAPREGYVTQKFINEGSFVKKGKTLFQIADLSVIWVIAKIYQEDLPAIHLGDKVRVDIEGAGEFEGKVDFIYPDVNPKTHTIDMRIVLPNPALKIYPGMFARATVATVTKEALVLPKTAVLTKGKKHFVFLDKGATYAPKEISARRIDAYSFEILSGLKAGERVIDRAMFMLDSDAITNGLYDSGDDEDW